MAKNEPTASASNVVPTGQLVHLEPHDLVQSANNPRRLFDPEPLSVLKENIRLHGVLVPLTVFQKHGSQKYEILDGARRHRCCIELLGEGIALKVPANVVVPPDKISGLLYMFSIHNFREDWELMPTALSLKQVIKSLGEEDSKKLASLTGLSEPQVERCKLLLSYPEKYQDYSLDPNPKTRVPSNFWIEATPVVALAMAKVPDLFPNGSRDDVLDALVIKYREKKIKSVIHFRRIIEAYEISSDDAQKEKRVIEKLREFLTNREAETRSLFDEFVVDSRRIASALGACDDFMRAMERAKIEHVIERDREQVRDLLRKVQKLVRRLLDRLEGEDAPESSRSE